jgi:hypothetical protein
MRGGVKAAEYPSDDGTATMWSSAAVPLINR